MLYIFNDSFPAILSMLNKKIKELKNEFKEKVKIRSVQEDCEREVISEQWIISTI